MANRITISVEELQNDLVRVNGRYLVEGDAFRLMGQARLPADLILVASVEEHYRRRILPEMNPAVRRDLYKQAYDELAEIHLQRGQIGHGVNDAFVELIAPWIEGARVLELGCGYGLMAKKISESVAEYVGIDASDACIAHAVASIPGRSNVRFIQMAAFDAPITSKKFDVVYSNDFVEHLHPSDLASVIKFSFQSLAPGGVFIAITSNRYFGPFDVSRAYVRVGSAARGLHLSELSYGEWVEILSAHGFSDLRTTLLPLSLSIALQKKFGYRNVLTTSTFVKRQAERIPLLRDILRRPLAMGSVIIWGRKSK